jgi:hypothetical protein
MQKFTIFLLASALFSCSESAKENVIAKSLEKASPVGSTWQNIKESKHSRSKYLNGADTCFALMNDYFINYDKKELFPFFMLVSAQTEKNNLRGFPLYEEQEIQGRLEDSLIMYFDRTKTPYCFLGHSTRRGFRDIMMYVNDTARAGQAISVFISKGTPRKTACTIVPDSGWTNIRGLYANN